MKLVLTGFTDTAISIQIDGDEDMIGYYKYADEIDQKHIDELNKVLIDEIKKNGINYQLEVCAA